MKKEDLNQEIELMNEWYLNYGRHEEKHCTIIDSLFRNKEFEKLVSLFNDKSFVNDFSSSNIISQMRIIIEIYILEIENNINDNILMHGKCLQDLIDYYSKIKFLIWRIEFECDQDAMLYFLDFMKNERASIVSIIGVINVCAFNKIEVAYSMSYILRKNKFDCLGAYELLKYAYEQDCDKDSDQILCEIADICWELKEYEIMKYWISKIINPTELLLKYKEKWVN